MTDPGLPTYLTRQYALSKAQLGTALGAELLSLCQSVTADGRLAPEELEGLKQWLHDADAAEMPAARYLRKSIERVLADGRITPEEYREVYRAVEAILPLEARKQALAARVEVDTTEAAAARLERAARQTGKPVADTIPLQPSVARGDLQASRSLGPRLVIGTALAIAVLIALYAVLV